MVRHTQTICRLLPTSCLSVFEHFVGLVLNELSIKKRIYIFIESWIVFLIYRDNSPYLYERFLWNTAREVIWFLKVNFLQSYFKNLWFHMKDLVVIHIEKPTLLFYSRFTALQRRCENIRKLWMTHWRR